MPELDEDQKRKLAEIIDTWDTASKAIRFLNAVGTLIKWILGIGSAIAIIWSVWHGGSPR